MKISDGVTLDLLERRLRLVAGSLVGDVTTVTEGEDTIAVGLVVDWAMAGTASWSCEPAPNWLVSGSDRQSPSSLDTNMAGSSVSMCVRLFDRPYSHNQRKRISFMAYGHTIMYKFLPDTNETYHSLIIAGDLNALNARSIQTVDDYQQHGKRAY